MLKNFSEFNESGIIIQPNFNNRPDVYGNIDEKLMNQFWDGSKKGLSWNYNEKKIIIKDINVSVIGRPTIDYLFIVAIYLGLQGNYVPPNNAVIYNLDGTVYIVLNVPQLISETVNKRLTFLNEPNPPLAWATSEGGLYFRGFGWYKNKDGELVNGITIELERGTYETRVINPVTGEFGECINSGLVQYAKIE